MRRAREGRGGEPVAKRGLGPFTGGQLTAIVIAVLAAIAFPIGAFAVTSSNVTVTDATSGNTAKVNASGQLNVTGTASPAPVNMLYHQASAGHETSGCQNMTNVLPGGKALVVTSITVDVTSGGSTPTVTIGVGDTTPCSTGALVDQREIPVHTSQQLTFPAGFSLKAGHMVSVTLHSSTGDAIALVTVQGYAVAGTQCQTGAGLPIGCI